MNGFFCRWVAQTRLPVEAYRAVSDDEAAAPRATDVPRRCGVPGVCESHDCVGLAAFLTTPLSFPLAVAFLCYNGCLFGRCGRASGRRWAALIGLALLCVTGGVTLRLLLAVCVVNLDDPCEGTPHLPKKFILDQSLHRVDKLTLTVMDEHSHPLGDREFQVKLKHRCSSPNALYAYDQTMEYREHGGTVAMWADRRRQIRRKAGHFEQWDIFDCNNTLHYTIEETEEMIAKEHTDLWLIKDRHGDLVARALRRELQSTEIVVYDFRHKGRAFGRMTQEVSVQMLKMKLRVVIDDESEVAPYVYGYLALLTKQRQWNEG
uniref:Uncharacterized protein n=1 Tax=Eutreptiella gymnastica TaxID=73025 RepID=A0A7S4LHH8_9EUGL